MQGKRRFLLHDMRNGLLLNGDFHMWLMWFGAASKMCSGLGVSSTALGRCSACAG